MKKTLVYELRRNILPLAVFCVCALLVSVFFVFTTNLSYTYRPYDTGEEVLELSNSCISVFTAILCVLCAVVPVMQFSYRMKQRSADLWYALPITRKKLVLTRLVGGFVLVFVPYTLAYWLGVACIAMREPHFAFWAYAAFYAISLPLGAVIFGTNAFLFTRGNTVADGIVFVVLWSVLLPCIMTVCFMWVNVPRQPFGGLGSSNYYNSFNGFDMAGFLFPYSPVAYTAGYFASFAEREPSSELSLFSLCFSVPLAVIEGAGAYVGLFVCADRDKSENAEQISASWMGYRVLAPVYAFLLLASVGSVFDGSVIAGVLLAIAGIALFFAYRRSFRLKACDLISYAAAVVLGIAVAIVLMST